MYSCIRKPLFKVYMFLLLRQVWSNSVKHVIKVENMLSCHCRPLFYSKDHDNLHVVHLLHVAVPVTGWQRLSIRNVFLLGTYCPNFLSREDIETLLKRLFFKVYVFWQDQFCSHKHENCKCHTYAAVSKKWVHKECFTVWKKGNFHIIDHFPSHVVFFINPQGLLI